MGKKKGGGKKGGKGKKGSALPSSMATGLPLQPPSNFARVL